MLLEEKTGWKIINISISKKRDEISKKLNFSIFLSTWILIIFHLSKIELWRLWNWKEKFFIPVKVIWLMNHKNNLVLKLYLFEKLTQNWKTNFESEQFSPCGLEDRQTYIHELGMCCLITGWNSLLLLWNTLYRRRDSNFFNGEILHENFS